MKKQRNCCRQKGAGSSDYVGSFHAWGADPAELSRFTLKHIDQAPVFHPLETGTIIPTGTSGVIPTGSYYDAVSPSFVKNSLGPAAQQGGGNSHVYYTTKAGKEITNPWIAHVYRYAEEHGIKYNEALKTPAVKKGYKKSKKN
uniref:Uncharacterized protein n=1 Tax=viral metagenome TaxID=1070528 RepID=A0A6C0BK19_9ZZZZ